MRRVSPCYTPVGSDAAAVPHQSDGRPLGRVANPINYTGIRNAHSISPSERNKVLSSYGSPGGISNGPPGLTPADSARDAGRKRTQLSDHYEASVRANSARSPRMQAWNEEADVPRSSARKSAQIKKVSAPKGPASSARDELSNLAAAQSQPLSDDAFPPEPGDSEKGTPSRGNHAGEKLDAKGRLQIEVLDSARSVGLGSADGKFPAAPPLNQFLELARYEEIHPLECVHNDPHVKLDLDVECEIDFPQWGMRVGNPFVWAGSKMRDCLVGR